MGARWDELTIDGEIAMQCGDLAKAERLFEAALRIARRKKDPQPDSAISLGHLGSVYRRQGRQGLAERAFRQSLEVLEPLSRLGRCTDEIQVVRGELAEFFEEQERYPEAEDVRRAHLETYERSHGPMSGFVICSLELLADLCAKQGKLEEARGLLDRARRICENEHEWNQSASRVMSSLVRVYAAQGRYSEALAMMREVLDLLREKRVSQPLMDEALDEYSDLLKKSPQPVLS